ncbi:hypothetical protein MK852_07105 [Shewanella benthica]|uniref:hypothetical protein n=1 Tax=Shewanella benthica TaxID=43661 RepID=UPI00187AC710|nr:hypothetical protein [Shewanella benthica]MBE7214863.1 hypothetical protein [Shewanella benthica]MCL1061905.1 hypothetical protein [Shewanella benthica]
MLEARAARSTKKMNVRSPSMVNLEALFTDIDDFYQKFVPEWQAILLKLNKKQRNKPSSLAMSEVMTILILFQHKQK